MIIVTPNKTNPTATKPTGFSLALKKINASNTVNTISAFDQSEVSDAVLWLKPRKKSKGASVAPQIATVIKIQ